MAKVTKEIAQGVSWATKILAAVSILAFAERAFAGAYPELLHRIVDFYHSIARFLLGWTEPYWKSVLAVAGNFFHIQLRLWPHWRDVFVLLTLYMGADVRSHLQRQRYINVYVAIPTGFLLALLGAIGAGAMPVDSQSFNPIAFGFAAGALATMALVFCVLTSTFYPPPNQSWMRTFTYYLKTTEAPFIVCALVAAMGGYGVQYRLPSPTIVALLFFLALLPIYWLGRGVWLAWTERERGQSFAHRFGQTGGAKLAKNILVVLGIASVVAAITAGLEFVHIG